MPTPFTNLYMSHSMHDLFNKSAARPEAGYPAIFLPRPSLEQFTIDAMMMAAANSYSGTPEDLSQYLDQQSLNPGPQENSHV